MDILIFTRAVIPRFKINSRVPGLAMNHLEIVVLEAQDQVVINQVR